MNLKDRLIQNSIEALEVRAKELRNSGYEIDITSLTGIKQKVTSQKFYEVQPSLYMPVVVGDNPFSTEISTYRDFATGNDFESGDIEQGSGNGKLETVDTMIDNVKVKVKSWGKKINYNIIDLNTASKSGNWSLIESKEKSRIKNWQLGIQRIAFLGHKIDTGVLGLLTQTGVTANTTLIDKFLKDMTATEFTAVVGGILPAYNTNAQNTVMPDTFVIPTSDFLGLGVPYSEDYPMISKLDYLTNMLKQATGNPNFKVLPLAYGNKARNADVLGSGSGLNRYALYRSNDEESLRMDIPVDFTTTIFDTFNNFEYESVAYGQYTGCKAYRPREVLYFDHSE